MTTPGCPLARMRVTIIRAVRAHAAALSPRALLLPGLARSLFVLSLAYFLFSYATTFGEPAADGAIAPARCVECRAVYASSRCTTASSRANACARRSRRVLPAAARAIVLRVGREPAVHRASARCGGRCRASPGSVDGAAGAGCCCAVQAGRRLADAPQRGGHRHLASSPGCAARRCQRPARRSNSRRPDRTAGCAIRSTRDGS